MNQNNNYIISEADNEEINEIVKLNKQIFSGIYEQEPYSLQHYQEKLQNLKPKIFIAKINNKIIGNSIALNRNDSLYIWIMGVGKKYRNLGIATNLFNNNEGFAQTKGYKSVTIKVYNVSNIMLKMLLKRGYQIIDITKSENNPIYNAIHLELFLKQ